MEEGWIERHGRRRPKKERSKIGIVNDGVRNRFICFASTSDSPVQSTLSLRVPLFAERAEPPPSSTPSPTNMQLRLPRHPPLLVPENPHPSSNTKPVASHPGGLTIPPPRVHSETNSRAHHARTTRLTSHHITSLNDAVYDISEEKRNTHSCHIAHLTWYT
jgi:hypothetical protein